MNLLGFEKILHHLDKLENIKREIPQYPIHATISLSNCCNERCLWCTAAAYQKGKKNAIEAEALYDYLKYAYSHGLKAVTYVGKGEPLTYDNFSTLTDKIHFLGLEQGLFTNGYLIDRYLNDIINKFTWIRVSLDAACQKTHDRLHGCKSHFNKTTNNIKDLRKKRNGKTPKIGIQFAVHQENVEELIPAAKLSYEIGADYFSVKPVFSRGAVGRRIAPNCLEDKNVYPLILESKSAIQDNAFEIYYRRFQFQSHSNEKNMLPYQKCVAGIFNINISEKGRLTICGPNEVDIGTIEVLNASLKEKIHSAMLDLDLSKCPAGCRYHALNHLVEQVLDPVGGKDIHANFI